MRKGMIDMRSLIYLNHGIFVILKGLVLKTFFPSSLMCKVSTFLLCAESSLPTFLSVY